MLEYRNKSLYDSQMAIAINNFEQALRHFWGNSLQVPYAHSASVCRKEWLKNA